MGPETMQRLVELTSALQHATSIDSMMAVLVGRLASILGVPRVTVRLLDETRTRLLTSARAGAPLHTQPCEFTPGEGLVGWIAEQCRPLRCDEGERDPRFVAKSSMRGPLGAFVGVPLMDGAACIGVISAIDPVLGRFTESEEQVLSLAAAMVAPHVQIARLRRLAQVDPLTGALNRRGFDDVYTEDAWTTTSTLSLVAADIDRFKDVNDRWGHAVGDRVLQAVAATLASIVRRGDAVVRMGGEEFLLALIGADLAAATHVAERARAAVEAQPIVNDEGPIAVTASFGVAQRMPGESRAELLTRADAALYRAKAAGRNRVEVDS
ncbi:MAG: sensor domain-containing diguanylate cyclase [Deltaproteobacteria bacterium]|nr:sensor domain-containing diguanylate cyclase [Deltaproteobacteria bacterium]